MQTNKVDLFFCGDSFTWGEELQGPEQNHRRREKERFSGVLAEQLGKTHENISRSGTSNDWIVKKSIEWFEKGNSCDTAIIQFSHYYRWMWYDKNGKHHHMPAKWKEQDTHMKTTEKQEAQKAYMSNVISEHFALDNYWKNMFLLRNYLKDKCNIIHLTLTELPLGKNFWYESVGNINIIELIPFLKKDQSNFCPKLNSNILDNNDNKRFSGAHPSTEGHKRIAQLIRETHLDKLST